MIKRALRAGTLADAITPVLLGSAFKNKGVQPLLDAVDRLPAEPARRAGDPRASTRRRSASSTREAAARRAVLGARVQGHVRPVRRQADLLPRLLRQAQGRRPGAEHDERQDRAHRPHPPDAREPPRGARGDRRGRDRRRRRPQADDDRRHARRRLGADRARVDDLPRPGDLASRSSRRRRPTRTSSAPGLARLAEEDPTFRVVVPTRRPARRSSPAWASSTSRSSSTG